MPQLDKLSWFSQIFWLFLVLGFLYYFFSLRLLPSLVSSIKFRTKFFHLLRLNQEVGLIDSVGVYKVRYGKLLRRVTRTKHKFYRFFKRKKYYFLERYSVLLYSAKFSKVVNKLYVEGFTKLRVVFGKLLVT